MGINPFRAGQASRAVEAGGEKHDALQERVQYLVRILGNAADKNAQGEQIHANQAKLAQELDIHCQNQTERMEHLEKSLGDAADKHAQVEQRHIEQEERRR